jgi:transcriptional regulator with XRE-family HTH domain
METRLRSERVARGYSQKDVALAVGTNPSNLLRLERGEQTPKHGLARAIFEFYGGVIPLCAIYDPVYSRERGLDGLELTAGTDANDVDKA